VEERKKQSEKTNYSEKSGVTVITMHGAKGLEYRIVFLLNINEGNVPYGKMLTKDTVEEERRIFYVAVTRAKEELEIFYVENENREKPSRFLPQSY
ncbi:MAG: ATP-binding domain-containing protein, partial [Lachnospiraceae bacterium]|nr:ATP-binding domain-containing protein [Lachnospiraceae bacterium]